MCGITGLITKKNDSVDVVQNKLSHMNGLISHRGPDQEGFFEKREENFLAGMAMRRLSIIDLTTGEQPMYSDDRALAIVFNGEIYNYKELKKELQDSGVLFKTTSDTEVILRLFEQRGTESFGMLDGMFAFSIYDDRKKKVFVARDFFGEKPLYYTLNSKNFYWASELKSITSVMDAKPSISRHALNLFFQLTYIPAPFSIYEDIHKLEPNHFLEFSCMDFSLDIKEIKQEVQEGINRGISFSEAKRVTQKMVRESVLSRSVADVPIGTFLSGGVDSSIVSLCLAKQTEKKIDTFSIGFKKKSFDESGKARIVANLINSNHHEFIISEKDLKEHIDPILLNFDEPFADSSSLPTYLVAHKTREYVKVALTGDGGDEVFGGYNKYYIGQLNSRYTKYVPEYFHQGLEKISAPLLATRDDQRGKRFQLKKLMRAINYSGDFYFRIISLGYQEDEAKQVLKENLFIANALAHYKNQVGKKIESLHEFRNIDRILSLEGDLLVKVDRTSMLTSLESRSPFLNKEIWNFTSTLPANFLINGWNKKFLLKQAFEEYFPENFLNKTKKGFGVPVGDWLRGHLSQELESFSSTEFLKKQGIFVVPVIQNLVKNHLTGKEDNTFRVWTFFCFQKWYKEIYSQL